MSAGEGSVSFSLAAVKAGGVRFTSPDAASR